MLLVLNLPLVGIWVKLLQIPRPLLYAGILVFATLGAYSLHNSSFDLVLLYIIGVLGFVMRRFDIPVAPVLIGLILGPLAEQQFRRALAISQGDLSVFVTHPISATVLAITALVLFGPADLGDACPRAAEPLRRDVDAPIVDSRMRVMNPDVDLRDWIGRTESRVDGVTRRRSRRSPRRSTATTPRPRPATRCRRCGTGCTSCRCTGNRELGPDGHAKRGGFLPPVPLPRRMWAGGRLDVRRSRCASASAIARDVAHRRRHAQGRALGAARVRAPCATRSADARGRRDRRGARHRLSRRCREPGDARPRRRSAPADAAWSRDDPCPTTCCCSAIRR